MAKPLSERVHNKVSDAWADLTASSLRSTLETTLGWNTSLGLFPVRHHSPTCARHLARWLHEFRPDCILIEGPAHFNDRINVLADAEHQTPFALVSVARRNGDMIGRAYYPFCDYSPELVAIRESVKLKATTRFIDLVHGERKADLNENDHDEERLGSAEDDSLAHSQFTQRIIKGSGCRDFDEVWEVFFEQMGWSKSALDWALEVMAYAHLSRAGYSQRELEADGTLERELCMATHIAEAQKQFKRVAVITGAFHSVALRDTPAKYQPPKKKDAAEIEVLLAPYTFPRLDALLGYASGMSGPQFYQYVWDVRSEPDPFAWAAERILVEATRLARTDGEVLGTADAIAALAFAQQLAHFRGRSRIGRVEVIEAARTCFIKGDSVLIGQRVDRALAEVMRGSKVGRLGASAGQSLLIQNFNRRLKELRLPIEHGRPQALELAIYASDLAFERSQFFHQCVALELPFCSWQAGPNLVTGERLSLSIEHWQVQYVPEVDTRLIEVSYLGSTIEDVASALLIRDCLKAESKSSELALLLVRGLVIGAHKTVEKIIPKLAAAMFVDDDPCSLLHAGMQLRTVLKGRERLQASHVRGFEQLAQQAFIQGTLKLEKLAHMGPERMKEILEVLAALFDVILTEPSLAPSRSLACTHAHNARDEARAKSPTVLGALDGFLLQLGAFDIQNMVKQLMALRMKADGLGSYLEGIAAIARNALFEDSPLLTTLIEYIRDVDQTTFLAQLPSLRRAFTQLTPRETEQVAERVAAILGVVLPNAFEQLPDSPELIARLSEWEQNFNAQEQAWATLPNALPERSS